MSTFDAAYPSVHQGIVPGYLLAQLARSERYPHAAAAARQTLIAGRPAFHAALELSIDENGDLVAEVTSATSAPFSSIDSSSAAWKAGRPAMSVCLAAWAARG